MNAAKQAFAKAAQAAQAARAAGGGAGGGGGAAPGGGGSGAAGAALALASLLGVGVGGYGLYHSFVTVQPGHMGVVYNRMGGLKDKATLTEGMNFLTPWFQRAVVFDIRTRPQLINTQSGSKDLQMVAISLRVLFRPDSQNLPAIYRTLGTDFDARVLPSIVNEVTKAVVAQYNASELLTKRDEVSAKVRAMLVTRADNFHIILEDVSIPHLAFSKEYTAAVEAKQVAQQDAERSKYIVDKAREEKRTIIIRAEGEAKSAELIGNAVKENPAFLQLRKIEASREIANTVVNSTNKVYLSSDTLLLNALGDQAGKDPTNKKGWW
jgi:prohibitin 2